MNYDIKKYLEWIVDESFDSDEIMTGNHVVVQENIIRDLDHKVMFSAYAPKKNYIALKNHSFLEEVFSQLEFEFNSFFEKLLHKIESNDDKKYLEELRYKVFDFYIYLLLPDVSELVKNKNAIKTNGNSHPEIKKLLSKIFFLTSFTYEVLSGNTKNLNEIFKKIPGKKIKENRLSSYIMITRLIESEGLSERLSIRKLSPQLNLYVEEQTEMDYDKYENLVRAYNKWKNENSAIYDLIVKSIREGVSDESILLKIRTPYFN